jgi:hypothetical protein
VTETSLLPNERAVTRTFDPRVHKGLLRTYDGVGTFSGEVRPDHGVRQRPVLVTAERVEHRKRPP